MGLLWGRVSSVWLIHDVKLAKQIQLGPQLLPGASGDVLETLNIDGNIDAAFVHLQRWTHLLEVIKHAKYEARPFVMLSSTPAAMKHRGSANTLWVCDSISETDWHHCWLLRERNTKSLALVFLKMCKITSVSQKHHEKYFSTVGFCVLSQARVIKVLERVIRLCRQITVII